MAMGNLPPIEDKGAYGGFFPALWHTWVSACFRPTTFFETVGNSPKLPSALLFGTAFGWVGLVFSILWDGAALWDMTFRWGIITMRGWHEGTFGQLLGKVDELVCAIAFGWLFAFGFICFYGFVCHLFLWLFGGAKRGLTVTLQVIAYAQATQIFAAVPVIGARLGMLWSFVLLIYGLAAAHRTAHWRAAAALIAPFACLLLTLIAWMEATGID